MGGEALALPAQIDGRPVSLVSVGWQTGPGSPCTGLEAHAQPSHGGDKPLGLSTIQWPHAA